MSEAVAVTKSAVVLKVDFFHTSVGIFLKRILFAVVANAGMLLYNGLVADEVDWNAVRLSALTSALYVVISSVSTLADKQIPNVPSETVKVEKA